MTQPQTVTTDELLLRLITGREHLDPDQARRLLAEHRDQLLTGGAELIRSRVESHSYCAELLLAARTTQES